MTIFSENKSDIIQFSPIRSGSTLIFNILKEIFPKQNIIKLHKINYNVKNKTIVITFRHPLDCIASSIQRYNLNPTNEVIEEQLNEFERNGGMDIFKIINNDNILKLKYENFYNNFENIFKNIEKHFNISIDKNEKLRLKSEYNIEQIANLVRDKKDFSEYDANTHWHGKHISRFKGQPFYYKYFFNEEQVEYLKKRCSRFMLVFGYS